MAIQSFLFSHKNKLRISLALILVVLTGCQNLAVKTRSENRPMTSQSTNQPEQTTSPEGETPSVNEPEKESLKIGLILGPGFVRSYAHAGFLQEVHRAQIKIHAIAGIEMGALAAALYAREGKGFEVEWQMMKLKDDELSDRSLVGTRRQIEASRLLQSLSDVFGNDRAESSEVPFVCPSLNLSSQKVFLMSRGAWSQMLPFCLALPPQMKSHQQSIAAATTLKSVADHLRSRGANRIVFVNALGGTKDDKDVQWSLIHQALISQQTAVDEFIQLPVMDQATSEPQQRRALIQKGQQEARLWTARIKREL
jgi:NTE family protein